MPLLSPKAESVTAQGQPDGFEVQAGWESQLGNAGDTRLLISVPVVDLPRVHAIVLAALEPPLAFLYRRRVDRRNPKPNGTPPEDYLAHGVSLDEVLAALQGAADLVYSDARCEVWVRGMMGEQVILDHDGLLYAYPDDPTFRDRLEQAGVPERHVPVLLDRDYVKHHFYANCDALEDWLLRELAMIRVATQEDPQ